MSGLLRYSLYGTSDAAQNWEEELAATLSKFKLTRGIACPSVWQCRSRGEHVVATVQGDDITIGGKRPAVQLLIKMISMKLEIKKQMMSEDTDLENSGRILNRVIEWGRDGITSEADQRHVRESFKELDLCAVVRKKRGKGENRCEQGQTDTQHNWDNESERR